MKNLTDTNSHYSSLHYSMFNIRYSRFDAVGFFNTEIPHQDKYKPVCSYSVRTNFPNPFSGSTTLNYDLSEDAIVEINIYDYTGKLVKTLTEGNKETGKHSAALFAGELNSGIYFCTIQGNGIISGSQKITVIK